MASAALNSERLLSAQLRQLKLQYLDLANFLKDFYSKINFPPMRALVFIMRHLIYNLAYTYEFQLKTTMYRRKLVLINVIE